MDEVYGLGLQVIGLVMFFDFSFERTLVRCPSESGSWTSSSPAVHKPILVSETGHELEVDKATSLCEVYSCNQDT
jgi:hypothetical protein